MLKLQTDLMEWKMALAASECEWDPKLAQLEFRHSPQITSIFLMPLPFPITRDSVKEHGLVWTSVGS